ncbi:MAG: response regulator transcription factor [Armatimonadota bacterium]|nr:response regulator transcription factor [Armatimonadota bacterium]MDR5688443.1 response regulator transcription factor [Armatimonadota bacterium]MDR7387128.1 response regulator transcription factor [Armatimonadota bacterium]MDR7388960.1 response regulator transcription factor [Armatimonadota bacterium]MDR7395820.1 response regulator transcription factor [Armatimonadota bacterium]
MQQKVLVVDDEPHIVELVRYNLEREGFQVSVAYDGHEALQRARAERPDLIVLDLMLPYVDGLEVCRALRRESTVPILMLTAKDGELDRVLGLETGADDYVTKPFSPRELVARVRAILRRARPESAAGAGQPQLVAGDLVLDPNTREVFLAGRPVDLTTKEFDLLRLLMAHPNRVFTRDALLEHVWGYDYLGSTRTVDMHISRLRDKIEDDPASPTYIVTVRGVGYKFKVPEAGRKTRRPGTR